MAARRPKVRVGFVSLGCPKNLVDSERMLASLGQKGFVLSSEADADLLVVNTCGFLQASRDESLGVVREAVARKGRGELQAVVLAGCLAQKDGEALLAEVPGLDAVLGVNDRDRLAALCRRVLEGQGGRRTLRSEAPRGCASDRVRFRLTPRHYAYLRISEGCDNPCTFCTIPAIRGPFRSKRPRDLRAEVEELVADGAVEFVVIGQDTTGYGRDLRPRSSTARLLEDLAGIEGVRWLRLLYAYPGHFEEALVRVLAEVPEVLPYVDLPIQHVAGPVLAGMGRGSSGDPIRRWIDRMREAVPNLVLRTSLIVGFPGEGEREFEELLDFLRTYRLERVGVFPFSPETGTPAADLPGAVSEEVRTERVERVLEVQRGVALSIAKSWVGRTMEGIVDGPTDAPGLWRARTYADAPEVDPMVHLRGEGFRSGEILPIQLTAAREYDMEGTAAGPARAALSGTKDATRSEHGN